MSSELGFLQLDGSQDGQEIHRRSMKFFDARAVTMHPSIRCTVYFFPGEYISHSSVREPNIVEYNEINNPECLLLSQV